MKELSLYIEQMDCPTEEQLIRRRLKNYDGIEKLEFDLVRRELTIQHHLSGIEPLLKLLQTLGMDAEIVTKEPADESARSRVWKRKPVISRVEWFQLGIAGIMAISAEILELTTPEGSVWVAVLAALSIPNVCSNFSTGSIPDK